MFLVLMSAAERCVVERPFLLITKEQEYNGISATTNEALLADNILFYEPAVSSARKSQCLL